MRNNSLFLGTSGITSFSTIHVVSQHALPEGTAFTTILANHYIESNLRGGLWKIIDRFDRVIHISGFFSVYHYIAHHIAVWLHSQRFLYAVSKTLTFRREVFLWSSLIGFQITGLLILCPLLLGSLGSQNLERITDLLL